jgi:3-isopropylmalate/(R)-2-methylmalate dehydratase small subunit
VIVEGRAVCVPGDNVDTDVLYPGPYLNITDPELMKAHLFEGLDPSLRDRLGGDTVLVVGENFGTGSSREHVPVSMKASGIRAVVGPSFARIFYRNCLNLGLLAIMSSAAAAAARQDARIRIDTTAGEVEVDGIAHSAQALPLFVAEMVEAGGLVEWSRLQPGGGPRVTA